MTAKLIELGNTVIGCGRTKAAIDSLRARCGTPHRFDTIDVRNDDLVAEWAADVLARYSAPDLLINNAATINANASLWDVPANEFSTVIDVNIKGVTNVIRHFVPAMIARGSGVIINFSSGWGRSTAPDVAPYCATKWAIEGLTGSLAQELPRGMAAVALNPGIIDTEMLRSCFGEGAAHYSNPEAWAESAVPYLLTLDESHNGESLTAPG